jgi:hypothetical protein
MTSRVHHDWLRAVALDAALSDRARRVALAIARRIAVSGKCNLSYSVIAAECDMQRNAAIRAVRELTKRGWLGKLVVGSKQSNSYEIVFKSASGPPDRMP